MSKCRLLHWYRLSDVEGVIAEMEELMEVPEEIMEEDTEYRIIRSGWWYGFQSLICVCMRECF